MFCMIIHDFLNSPGNTLHVMFICVKVEQEKLFCDIAST